MAADQNRTGSNVLPAAKDGNGRVDIRQSAIRAA
jgi:hypothetical protein